MNSSGRSQRAEWDASTWIEDIWRRRSLDFSLSHAFRFVRAWEHIGNRFVFMIAGRFYETARAFVPGKVSTNYRFTSSAGVKELKNLEPELVPMLRKVESTGERYGETG